MNLFYAELWDGDKPVPPLEALRRAQLAVYRDPALVKAWSRERGASPILKKATASAATPAPIKPGARTSPARAWAAFVLSGPGD